jgi:hypothetical protein
LRRLLLRSKAGFFVELFVSHDKPPIWDSKM